MQGSASRSLKALTAKIHRQLPLSPRESQQLLTALTDSFRQQLDQEHPTLPGQRHGALIASRSASSDLRPSSASSTAQHLEAVLTSPLFGGTSNELGSHRLTPAETRRWVDNPLGWFEGQAAAGTASAWGADVCLQALLNALPAGSSSSRRAAMKDTRAGSRIYQWLWSASLIVASDFIKRHTLVRNLALFLGAEGRYDVLWRCLSHEERHLTGDPSIASRDVRRWKAVFLKAFIEIETSRSETAAIQLFIRARDTLKANGQSTRRVLASASVPIFKLYASRPALQGASRTVSPEVFERFIEITPEWSGHWQLHQAVLWLNHPTSATTRPGLEYLFDIDSSQLSGNIENNRFHRDIISLALNLAHSLLQEQSHKDAQWILEFVRMNFSRELGLQPRVTAGASEKHSCSEQELANLQVLEALLIS